MKNVWEVSGEKNQENGPLAEKWLDRKSKKTRQNNKRGDRKEESKNSPEIPDGGGGGGGGGGHQTSPASLWGHVTWFNLIEV